MEFLKDLLSKYDKGGLGFPTDATLEKTGITEEALNDLVFGAHLSIKPPLFHEDLGDRKWRAIPEQYVPYMIAMIMVRYQKAYTYKEAQERLESLGYKVSSQGQITNIFNRMEHKMGLKDLPRTPERITRSKKGKPRNQSKESRDQLKNARKAKEAKAAIRKAERDKRNAEQVLRRQDIKAGRDPKKTRDSLKEVKLEKDIEKSLERNKPKDRKILYEPQPKQALFHAAGETCVLYGGAAGGGKSYSMMVDALRYCHFGDYRALIIRKNTKSLKELISVSKSLYPKAFPGAKFNKQEGIWYFPSGATIELGYLDRPEDAEENYQGLPYAYIGFDEVQHQSTPEGFEFLMSRLRSANPEIECYMRASANPGGAPWVKEYFIDPAEPNTTFWRNGISWKFIPARLEDNKYLNEPKPGEEHSAYRRMLMALPEHKRKQLLEGDWLAGDDAMFAFIPAVHITEEDPPEHWNRIRAMDYGYRDPASTLWCAVSPTNQIVVYDEHELIEVPAAEWASKVLEKERADTGPFGIAGRLEEVIDWSVFKNTGHTGPGILEQVHRLGMRPRPADRNREAGWNQIHNRLMAFEGSPPGLIIHSRCVKLIDQLQGARIHPKKPDDIDDGRSQSLGRKHHWDLLDCLRYACMARPSTMSFEERSLKHKQQASMEDTWKKFGINSPMPTVDNVESGEHGESFKASNLRSTGTF